MLSDHIQIQLLVDIARQKGLKHIVFSPGSRNAPLVISFHHADCFQCYTIPDERSAAFFAMGLALQKQEPVAICCTSGTAALNYAPAIAEAYYQHIPLVVLTADRPSEWIDMGEGQSINQHQVFNNYIRHQCTLPEIGNNNNHQWYVSRLINECLEHSMQPAPGPVHINIPLSEPLYATVESPAVSTDVNTFESVYPEPSIRSDELLELKHLWEQSERKLILVGQYPPVNKLNNLLEELASNPSVVVLTETTANLNSRKFCSSIDRLIDSFVEADTLDFQPDLVMTFGTAVISKKIKHFLRSHPPKNHWHIDPVDQPKDTFKCLSKVIFAQPIPILEALSNCSSPAKSNFGGIWKKRDLLTQEAHKTFLSDAAFSDLKAFELILDCVPEKSILHMGNSSVVRYIQLFDPIRNVNYQSNRGVSGIDGSTSTAMGHAFSSEKLNILITGELSFLYDSNALWNKYGSNNLKIIVINNSGGGIFRIIPGPSSTPYLEDFFDTEQNADIEALAKAYHVNYRCAINQQELYDQLPEFLEIKDTRPEILEIKTPKRKNDLVLKSYFEHLKKAIHGTA